MAAPPQLGGPLPTPLPLFPPDNWWNLDISAAPLDSNSAAVINFIGGDQLHPDFGGEFDPGSVNIYGFPYIVVDSTQPKRTVTFEYADESDNIGYPIPDEAITQPHWIEHGEPGNQDVPDVDRHMIIVDKDNKYLYELYNTFWDGSKWTAVGGAFFDMKTNNRRPEGWTSADAAGLAILPGLVRYDEVYGPDEIKHAFRFTVRLSNGYVYPASHEAGSTSGALPMGARLRLKASKNISGFPADMQKIFRAMKKYGLIVADNGTDMYIQGTFDTRWNNDILNPAFAGLNANDFEVVQLGYRGGPSVTVAAPNGGEQWTVGSSRQITWTSANLATGATAEISLTDGTTTTAIASVAASQGSYAWTVPNSPGTAWRIRIDAKSSGTVQATDTSDATFTIAAPASSLTVTGPSPVTEGNSGTVNAVFTVTMSPSSTSTVTVNYATANGTATAGSDYVAVSGTLTFTAGQTSKTVSVAVNGDTADEPDEAFYLNLSNSTNATIATGQATATIVDDDLPAVSMSINDVSVTEGNSGTTNAVLTVTLSGAAGQTVTANYATANGTATAGSDYVAQSGNLTFTAGQTSKTIAIVVNGDTSVEPNETFVVNLTNPAGATLADGQGQVTIVNDDLPALSINDMSSTEGNSGTKGFAFTVSLSTASSSTVTVSYGTADGTATAGSDYVAQSGTLSFTAGQTSKTITITINGDTTVEPNETFVVNLSSPSGATIAGGQGQGTITNDDTPPLPTLSINDVSDTEGNSGGKSLAFVVTLSAASSSAVTVNYATADGTATAGSDYVAQSGTLSFAAGQTSKAITITISGDTTVESNETFVVNLSSPSGATIADGQGQGTITNDDTAPPPPVTDSVVWTSPAGVTVSGNSLTKTAANGWGNAGAISTQQLASGDGFAEFTASETNTYRLLGLANGNTDNGYQDIDFAIDAYAGGLIQVYESGVFKGTYGTFVTGDRLRIGVVSGVVQYYKNGSVIYTSTKAPAYPLLVDTSLYNTASTLNAAVVSGFSTPSPPPSTGDPVVWTSALGVTVNGSSLTKTAANGWGNAGAISTQTLASGDGYVEFTASEANTYRLLGLSNGNTDAGYQDIDFAIDAYAGGQIQVWENGVYKGTYGAFVTGDKLRIGVVRGVVQYYKNGSVVYTSTKTPTYPLLVDASLYSTGSTLNAAVVSGFSSTSSGDEAAVWASAVGVTVDGNSLTKTAANGWGNAGAVSIQQLTSGDGYVEITASETTTYRLLGLSNGNSDASYQDIDFAIDAYAGGQIQVWESGVYKGTYGTFVTGDKLRVAVVSGVVQYYKNGSVVYASAKTPTYPLLVDTSLYSTGSTLSTAVVNGFSAPAPPAGTPVVWTSAMGVTVNANSLNKTAAEGWGNAGAISTQQLAAGDGYVEFAASETNTYRLLGLSNGNTDVGYQDIDFAIDAYAGGLICIYENGVYKGSYGTFAPGDNLRVGVVSGVVKYYKNGSVVYTSTKVPTYPLLVDTALYNTGSTLNSVVVSGF
jgi:hypothetical protein